MNPLEDGNTCHTCHMLWTGHALELRNTQSKGLVPSADYYPLAVLPFLQ